MDELEAVQQQLSTADIYMLAALTTLAAASGLFRSIDDHEYRDMWHLVSLGALSGAVGLACCSIVAWILGGIVGNELFLLFVAPVAGLSGKTLEVRIRRKLLNGIDKILDKVFGTNGNERRPEHDAEKRDN